MKYKKKLQLIRITLTENKKITEYYYHPPQKKIKDHGTKRSFTIISDHC